MQWMCTECFEKNHREWQKDCWACSAKKRDHCRWFFEDGTEMKGAEATYKQELKEQKEAAQAAKAARAATEADEHWGEAATEGYCRAWEMEICECPAGTPPLPKLIPGEKKLRCSECLRPYQVCQNICLVPGAKSPPPLPPGHRGVVEPKSSSTSAKPKPVPPLRSPPATEASKAAKAVEASKASQAAESSKSSKAKAVEEQMLADAKAKLIKGKSSNDRVQWTASRISEMKRINALNLEPAQLKSPAQPEVSTEEEEVSEFSWVRLNRTQERLKRLPPPKYGKPSK